MQRKPELIHRCLNQMNNQLHHLWKRSGIDFGILAERIPSEKEFKNAAFFPEFLERTFSELFEYIHQTLKKEKELQEDPLEWTHDAFDLEHRIKLEKLERSGMIEKYADRLVPKERLISYMYNHDTTSTPTRAMYYESRVIKTEEYADVQRRFGDAVILQSLPDTSPLKGVLVDAIGIVHDAVTSVDLVTRLHPKRFKQKYPREYALARKLFGNYESMLQAVAGHSYSIDTTQILEEAQRKFVLKEDAATFLKEHKIRPHIREKMLKRFKRRLSAFTGHTSNVNTSKLEEEVQEYFESAGIFYRRQVPYREFTQTDKKYVADFIVGDTVIEVIAKEDEFIHDAAYFTRLEEKKRLASARGLQFLVIDTLDAELLGIRATIPEEAFHIEKQRAYIHPEEQQVRTPNISDGIILPASRSLFRYSEQQKIGIKRKKHIFSTV